jgi:60S ribosomal subunit assembly/export protein LOC1
MITPASVQKPSGKKKGKIFVDDEESMMTILAMVNAEKEGQIESKIMKARQLEEVREARRKEAEKRSESKREVVAGKMKEMKKGRKGKGTADEQGDGADKQEARKGKSNKKRVSFA